MIKFIEESIAILKNHINKIDVEISKNYKNPDYVEGYTDVRIALTNELINLYSLLKKERQWVKYGKNMGSFTSQKNSFMD